MEDSSLKETFEKTYPPEHAYWTYSADQRVLYEQNQGGKGNRSSLNTSSGSEVILQNKKDKDDDGADFIEFATAMQEAQRQFIEASRAAQAALSDLGETINRSHEELERLKAEFEQNTVTLDDGTRAYYNKETGLFEQQDEQGHWTALDDEDRIAEAYRKAQEKNGLVSTKQGKDALDQRQAEIENAELYMSNQQQRLEDIDKEVENGTMSHDDATKQKEQMIEEIRDFEQLFEQENMDLSQKALPVAIEEINQSKDHYGKQNSEELGIQSVPDSYKVTSNNNDDTPGFNSNGISAFGSAFDTNQKISTAFSQHSSGIVEPKPDISAEDPKITPEPAKSFGREF